MKNIFILFLAVGIAASASTSQNTQGSETNQESGSIANAAAGDFEFLKYFGDLFGKIFNGTNDTNSSSDRNESPEIDSTGVNQSGESKIQVFGGGVGQVIVGQSTVSSNGTIGAYSVASTGVKQTGNNNIQIIKNGTGQIIRGSSSVKGSNTNSGSSQSVPTVSPALPETVNVELSQSNNGSSTAQNSGDNNSSSNEVHEIQPYPKDEGENNPTNGGIPTVQSNKNSPSSSDVYEIKSLQEAGSSQNNSDVPTVGSNRDNNTLDIAVYQILPFQVLKAGSSQTNDDVSTGDKNNASSSEILEIQPYAAYQANN